MAHAGGSSACWRRDGRAVGGGCPCDSFLWGLYDPPPPPPPASNSPLVQLESSDLNSSVASSVCSCSLRPWWRPGLLWWPLLFRRSSLPWPSPPVLLTRTMNACLSSSSSSRLHLLHRSFRLASWSLFRYSASRPPLSRIFMSYASTTSLLPGCPFACGPPPPPVCSGRRYLAAVRRWRKKNRTVHTAKVPNAVLTTAKATDALLWPPPPTVMGWEEGGVGVPAVC